MPELTVFVLGLELAVTLPLAVAPSSVLSAALPLSPFSGSIATVWAAEGLPLLVLPLPTRLSCAFQNAIFICFRHLISLTNSWIGTMHYAYHIPQLALRTNM